MEYLWGGLAILLALLSFFSLSSQKTSNSSRKAQQAKSMKEAFKSIESRSAPKKLSSKDPSSKTMKVTQLWIYPIKSIRGCSVPSAMLTKEGFYLDRRFMLLKIDEKSGTVDNMHVTKFPSMCLFHTAIKDNTLIISYHAPGIKNPEKDTLEIPLDPESFEELDTVDVNMHSSPTTSYNMGEKYNKWFSERFGFKTVLAFWGGNPRLVLGNLPGRPATQGPKSRNALTNILTSLPIIGPFLEEDNGVIAFNDCAPYLVITESSVADVSTRLPPDTNMDITKFRANIILRGSSEAYSEDFWGELSFEDARIILTGNCGRCASLNVNYQTGESGTGKDGQVLKTLMKDRRVDQGMKYSPIFGRYGFVGQGGEGRVVRVGDEVVVSKRNEERTRFYWPGLST